MALSTPYNQSNSMESMMILGWGWSACGTSWIKVMELRVWSPKGNCTWIVLFNSLTCCVCALIDYLCFGGVWWSSFRFWLFWFKVHVVRLCFAHVLILIFCWWVHLLGCFGFLGIGFGVLVKFQDHVLGEGFEFNAQIVGFSYLVLGLYVSRFGSKVLGLSSWIMFWIKFWIGLFVFKFWFQVALVIF
jgi:hypothetical protein